ncbi:MAG: RDD family protein [Aeromicrobium sp.]|jgi:uncharacterized RDD family membrane protein YckC|nr:MAG: RDD family protein [Aeromicrobium sp.]
MTNAADAADMTDEPSLGRRLAALTIDWFIALGTAAAITRTPVFSEDRVNEWVPLVVFFVEVALLVGLLGFSIGKRIVGLRVINTNGEPIGMLRACIRTALLCLVVPAVIMTEDKRGLHDLAAGSKVVRG